MKKIILGLILGAMLGYGLLSFFLAEADGWLIMAWPKIDFKTDGIYYGYCMKQWPWWKIEHEIFEQEGGFVGRCSTTRVIDFSLDK
jgi:hypothetical protein